MLRSCLVALSVAAVPGFAQTADRDLPNGKELIAVYVGAKTCGPCLQPATKSAIVHMKELLSALAAAHGYAFSAVGVSTDWSTAEGIAFLRDNGPFDQIVVGGNWTNLAVEHYIWRDSSAVPAMPQVVVLERTVTTGRRMEFSAPRVLHRVLGGDEIPKWVNAGAPIALLAPLAPDK